jgi:hypothetical protein
MSGIRTIAVSKQGVIFDIEAEVQKLCPLTKASDDRFIGLVKRLDEEMSLLYNNRSSFLDCSSLPHADN